MNFINGKRLPLFGAVYNLPTALLGRIGRRGTALFSEIRCFFHECPFLLSSPLYLFDISS